ncbi:MAG TPA: transcriptional regulator [Pseudomonadales bacterium]
MYQDAQAAGHATRDGAHQLARGLGWFSIGLGFAELLAPDVLTRLIGARPHTALVRAFGAREVAAGIGRLSDRGTAEWMWARVAGDLVDLGSLWLAGEERRADRARIRLATAAVVGIALLDVAVASYLSQSSGSAGAPEAALEDHVIVNAPALHVPAA